MGRVLLHALTIALGLGLLAVVIIVSNNYGREHEKRRWKTWLHERRIPAHFFYHNGLYQPEPPE